MRRFHLFPLLALMLGACGGDPVGNCDLAPRSDCCVNDSECLDFYGADFPYCANPGRNSGTCSECARDADCGADEYCDFDADSFGICLPE